MPGSVIARCEPHDVSPHPSAVCPSWDALGGRSMQNIRRRSEWLCPGRRCGCSHPRSLWRRDLKAPCCSRAVRWQECKPDRAQRLSPSEHDRRGDPVRSHLQASAGGGTRHRHGTRGSDRGTGPGARLGRLGGEPVDWWRQSQSWAHRANRRSPRPPCAGPIAAPDGGSGQCQVACAEQAPRATFSIAARAAAYPAGLFRSRPWRRFVVWVQWHHLACRLAELPKQPASRRFWTSEARV